MLIILTNNVFATEEIINDQKSYLGINEFVLKAQEYTNEVFDDVNLDNLFDQMIIGKVDNNVIITNIFKSIKIQIYENISFITQIIIVVIIHSIIKCISDSLENDMVGKISYFLQYVIIVSIIINGFGSIISETQKVIFDLIEFMKLLIPLLITLMLTTGEFAFANIVQPILIFVMNLIGEIITSFIIPIIMSSMILGIACSFSKEICVDKLSKFMKKTCIWTFGIILTIFVGILSLEGTLGKNVDSLTSKTAKALVSDFIPVFGKILGDTAETIIGCSKVLKGSVGVLGIIVLSAIVIIPMIKVLLLWFSFKLTACFCEVVADEKIVKVIEEVSDCYKVLFGVLVTVFIMFVIGITIIIKSTS